MSHPIHPREEWIGAVPWDHTVNGRGQFYICPPFKGWPAITDAVIHYPGADWEDMDFNNDGSVDLKDTKQIIQQMHRAYLMGDRGYSLGYSFVIGQTGDIWESRGWRNSNAANLGDRAHDHVGWNNYSISVNLIVDEQDPATSAQVSAVNWLLGEFEHRKGGDLSLLYHGMGQSTSCAGLGIIGQIKDGTIRADKPKPPKPPEPEPVPAGDTEMIRVDYGIDGTDDWWARMLIGGVGLTWVQGHANDGLDKMVPAHIQVKDDEHMEHLMLTYKCVGSPPSTWSGNPRLQQLWIESTEKKG